MSIQSVLEAAAALRNVNDRINSLRDEKTTLNARVSQINAELATLQTEKDARVAALKTEAGTI